MISPALILFSDITLTSTSAPLVSILAGYGCFTAALKLPSLNFLMILVRYIGGHFLVRKMVPRLWRILFIQGLSIQIFTDITIGWKVCFT